MSRQRFSAMSQENSHQYAEVHRGENSGSVSNDASDNIKGGRRLNHSITVATVVSFCLNIGLLVTLIVYHQKDTSNEKLKPAAARHAEKWLTDSVCVDCGILGLSPDQASSRSSGWLLSLHEARLCCLEEAWGLWRLINLFNMKIRMKQLNGPKKTTRLPVPSAHLYLDSLAAEDSFKWTDEYGFGAAHITESIKFRNESYRIGHAGFYNIYSFITLKRRTDSSISSVISYSIQVIRNSIKPHTAVVLQKSVELPRRSESFATNYLSGVVLLKSQDEISVYVSDRTALYRFAPSNFFGLHIVQNI